MGWYHNGLIKVDIVNGYTTATMMDGNIMGIWMDMIIIYDNIFIIYTEKQCIQPIETGYKTTSNGDIMWIDWKYIYITTHMAQYLCFHSPEMVDLLHLLVFSSGKSPIFGQPWTSTGFMILISMQQIIQIFPSVALKQCEASGARRLSSFVAWSHLKKSGIFRKTSATRKSKHIQTKPWTVNPQLIK